MARELLSARYAQALFVLAREQGVVDKVQSDFAAFASLLEVPELAQLFFHPKVQKESKKELLDKLGTGFSNLAIDFLKLLVDKRREAAVKGIISYYNGLAVAERGEIEAQVTTARALTEGEIKDLSTRLGGGVRRVVLQQKVDPSLLGGMVVRVGNKIYDGSVAGRLDRLKKRFNQVQVRIAEVKEVAP